MVNCNVGKPFRGFRTRFNRGNRRGSSTHGRCPRVATDSDSIFSLEKTPINLAVLKKELQNYPVKKVAEEIATGFEFGFPLHYNRPPMPREFKNLKSASDHPEIVQQKLQ